MEKIDKELSAVKDTVQKIDDVEQGIFPDDNQLEHLKKLKKLEKEKNKLNIKINIAIEEKEIIKNQSFAL